MFKNKLIVVKLSSEAFKVYEQLNGIVGLEKLKGIENSFHQTLFRSILRARDLLKENPFLGEQIQKGRIPKRYSKKYEVENLWRLELPNRWRLIYTIEGNEIKITNFILDIFNHRDYDKTFGYKH
jgi:mRNA-degrading endonuclease RelE of RelBE toxin-antitoxin system